MTLRVRAVIYERLLACYSPLGRSEEERPRKSRPRHQRARAFV